LTLFIPGLKGAKGALYSHPTEITFVNPNESKKPVPVKQTKVSKAVTITCIKGKLIKKISGIKPLCPTGYSKK
jgi:predicted ribosome-associated RNA-binding protein Tma20